MAELDPKLHEDVFEFLVDRPVLRLPQSREDALLPALRHRDVLRDVEWVGSPRRFTSQLIATLNHDDLCDVLRAFDDGVDVAARLDELCARIMAAAATANRPVAGGLDAYHRDLRRRLEEAYRVQSRFVALHLLINEERIGYTREENRPVYHSLRTLLDDIEEQAVILLGPPGSGKSTLLRRLAVEQCWAEMEEPSGRAVMLVPLNAYRAEPGGALLSPRRWLEKRWADDNPHLPPLGGFLDEGKVLLLLDGLNEMPHRDDAGYRERVLAWREFVRWNQARGNTVVFSCRSLDYSTLLDSEGTPVRQVDVGQFSDRMIRHYLDLDLGERAEQVWRVISRDSRQLSLFRTPFFLWILGETVRGLEEIPQGRAGLLTAFVRSALRREVARQDPLFDEASGLLDEADRLAISGRRWPGRHGLPEGGPLIGLLTDLAWRMQKGSENGEQGLVRLTENDAVALLNHPLARQALTAGIQLNVLHRDPGRREITFYHQLIQEYFAARRLAREQDTRLVRVRWRKRLSTRVLDAVAPRRSRSLVTAAPQTGWEETTILAAALTEDATAYVQALQHVNLPLAGRCTGTSGVVAAEELRSRLQEMLLERMRDERAALSARLAAGEALFELGHPDYSEGPNGQYLLPPFRDMPGVVYFVRDQNNRFLHIDPEHPEKISPFALARYPVTNAEFRRFVDDGGYSTCKWWQTDAAKKWLEKQTASEYGLRPRYWQNPRFDHPLQPIVRVNLYEAQAYCAWLSDRTGELYALPTEAEWDAAARGQERRTYAYGDHYDPAKGNTSDSAIGRPTPVGFYSAEYNTPEDVADLTGNVWEWTSTRYRYRSSAPMQYVLRGGSWNCDERGVRFHRAVSPDIRNHDFGFRLVRRSPSDDL